MFCSKCGKEIMDEAVICPNCGCATNNYQATNTAQNTTSIYSEDYPIIKNFADVAKNIKTLGIIAAVLMLGIGLIFSSIIWITTSKVKIPEITTTNPNEIAEFESAKRNYNLGKALAILPVAAICLCFSIGIFIGMFMAL